MLGSNGFSINLRHQRNRPMGKVEAMPFGGNVQVIVVPDDDNDARRYPPGIIAMLGPDNVLMSNGVRGGILGGVVAWLIFRAMPGIWREDRCHLAATCR